MTAEPRSTRRPAGADKAHAPAAGQPALPFGKSQSAATGEARSAAGARRLLVVDDEVQVRSLVKMMGAYLGCEVVEATNGAEALLQLQQDPTGIEIMLTDVAMPIMDGLELVRAANKLSARPAIAVMSGCFDADVRAALAAEGVTIFLAKPFSVEELGLTLGKLQSVRR